MKYPERFLDDIRARVSLESVIGRRVRLARRGHELIGLCPFHNEKTPSFTVSERKGFFHCFGCGAHGDVIGFVMQDEGLGFHEAVERLAGEAGLALPKREPRDEEREKRRASLYEVTEAAAAWFQAALEGAEGGAARRYLAARGLDAETVARFRLGYAPKGRSVLRRALGDKGISEAALVETGLLTVPEDGKQPYDRFRDRVIFPICDRRGRVVAFGGRALGDGKPKYLNSPETPLFHKGAVLYGHHLATKAAHDAGRVIAVEGYMDVIALHRAGFNEAVAPLGTALTERQIEALWRLAETPVLCFDGDDAGARAAARACERALPLLGAPRSLAFATLPPGQDPDSMIREGGAQAMAEILEAAMPLSEHLWQAATGGRAMRTPEQRAQAEQRLAGQVERIPDRGLRYRYLIHFRVRLQERPKRKGAGRAGATDVPIARGEALGPRAAGTGHRLERTLLQTLLNFPELAVEECEALAALRLETGRFAAALSTVLDWAGAGDDEKGESLAEALARQGFADLVEELAGDGARYLDWAASRAQAGLADARIQLRQILERQRLRVALPAAVREAERAWTEEMTEQSWLRLRETVRQGHDAGDAPVEIPGYGESRA